MVLFDVKVGSDWLRINASTPYSSLYDGNTPYFLGDPYQKPKKHPPANQVRSIHEFDQTGSWVMFDELPADKRDKLERAFKCASEEILSTDDYVALSERLLRECFDDVRLVSSSWRKNQKY